MKPSYPLLSSIARENPLVYCITNMVAVNFVANGLLAVGASPIMANSPEESGALAAVAGALSLNMGMPNQMQVDAMLAAGKAANVAQRPVLFDPVAVFATPYRQAIAKQILQDVKIDVLRGNVSEIAYFAEDARFLGKGADAIRFDEQQESPPAVLFEIAKTVAKKWQCVVVMTGVWDIISDGEHVLWSSDGDPMMAKITATGCLHGAFLTAALAVQPSDADKVQYLAEASALYGAWGEKAARVSQNRGNGHYLMAFLDALGSPVETLKISG